MIPRALLELQDLAEETFEARSPRCLERIPAIVLSVGSGSGGRFSLVHHGQRQTVEPVDAAFATLKYVAHAPLGLFGVLFPGSLEAWEPDRGRLSELLGHLRSTLGDLDNLPVDETSRHSCQEILQVSIDFACAALERAQDRRAFTAYARSIEAPTQQTMEESARVQLEGIARQLSVWRNQVGEADWAELYAAVGTGWARVNNSPRQQALALAMGEGARERLFTIQGANTEEALLSRLGRILNQHDLAEIFFEDRERLDEDLMGRPATKLLGSPGRR